MTLKLPKEYKKYEMVKAGDLCHVCRLPFEKYDKMGWIDDKLTKPAHASCARKIGDIKVN